MKLFEPNRACSGLPDSIVTAQPVEIAFVPPAPRVRMERCRNTAAYRIQRIFPVLTLSLLLAGCGSLPPNSRWARSEIFFGLSRPDGGAVTHSEWQAFVNEVVTPKFPAGLTIVDSTGQWRNATGRIEHEPSKMLVLLHPASPAMEAQIDEIRTLYCRRFNQEAVMKVTSPARVAF